MILVRVSLFIDHIPLFTFDHFSMDAIDTVSLTASRLPKDSDAPLPRVPSPARHSGVPQDPSSDPDSPLGLGPGAHFPIRGESVESGLYHSGSTTEEDTGAVYLYSSPLVQNQMGLPENQNWGCPDAVGSQVRVYYNFYVLRYI
jgi:hypothetical protein